MNTLTNTKTAPVTRIEQEFTVLRVTNAHSRVARSRGEVSDKLTTAACMGLVFAASALGTAGMYMANYGGIREQLAIPLLWILTTLMGVFSVQATTELVRAFRNARAARLDLSKAICRLSEIV
jgi:hypothetical protein